mmetsp:Transcript_16991/g.29411  ORF Transcript_16991/g.29411 Transcript_16991/m.29411 type:complete len:83 (+) Transcript_16991:849-1097(+)
MWGAGRSGGRRLQHPGLKQCHVLQLSGNSGAKVQAAAHIRDMWQGMDIHPGWMHECMRLGTTRPTGGVQHKPKREHGQTTLK